MAFRKEQGNRGLASVNEARADRHRALVFGRVRFKGMAPQFWLWTAVVLGAFFVIYWRVVQGQVESAKGRVMAKQRAIAQTLGPRILPFRDKVEGWVSQLAGPWKGNLVGGELSLVELSKRPGVYLRVRQANARKAAAVRKAATRSLRDGFTSCLFVDRRSSDLAQGKQCKTAGDCDAGLLCNEWHVCKPPPRPFNMRLAYRAMRVLSTEWTDELHEANSDLAVVAYERDLDAVTKTDVPVAIELLHRAELFTLVIDEDPKGGLPKKLEDSDETEEERLQRVPHPARIGVWDIKSGKQLLRIRAQAGGQLVPVGKRSSSDPHNLAAQARQANSCALALEVKRALAPEPEQQPGPEPDENKPEAAP